MLLIDGVKYQEWIPEGENAEEELAQMVKEHNQDIFGENSIYLDKKQKLKSLAGVGSIPDGLVIMFENVPEWHIVEVELSSHDPYGHIVPQVDKFLNGIDNRDTRNKIIEALYDAIYSDDFLKLKTRQAIGLDKDVHKFLSDLIATTPTITIIIEEYTSQLKEALKKYSQKKVVEFRTYRREKAETVHAHLFEPLYKPVEPPRPPLPPPPLSKDTVEIEVRDIDIKWRCIYIPKAKWYLFPSIHTKIELQSSAGSIIQRNFDPRYHGLALGEWFTLYRVQAGDKVRIKPIEAMKKYIVEFLKK